jgi:hypothetical protein
MFSLEMRLRRTFRAAFMWLSLLLPLQSFAAVTCGQRDAANPSAASAAAAFAVQDHCAHGSPATHQHGDHPCGKCCCGAAMAVTPSHGIAALPAAPEISGAVIGRPPIIALDRLDRPPRFIPA